MNPLVFVSPGKQSARYKADQQPNNQAGGQNQLKADRIQTRNRIRSKYNSGERSKRSGCDAGQGCDPNARRVGEGHEERENKQQRDGPGEQIGRLVRDC